MRKQLLRAALGFGCIFGLAIHVCAQQLATLTVSVTDPAGRAVMQAQVTVASRETGPKRSELSTASGIAVIPGLAAGDYELTIEVRDRALEAAEFIPVESLGTTDDCGFSPFADDVSTSRETAFAKIKSRVGGTIMASKVLGV